MKQLFFTGILIASGLFFFLSDVLKLPTMKTARAMLGAGKENKKAAKTIEAWLMSGAVKLSNYIHMDEYKRSRMTNILKAAGYSMTPEGSFRADASCYFRFPAKLRGIGIQFVFRYKYRYNANRDSKNHHDT